MLQFWPKFYHLSITELYNYNKLKPIVTTDSYFLCQYVYLCL